MVEATMAELAAAMREAAATLVDRLDDERRRQVVHPFDGTLHRA